MHEHLFFFFSSIMLIFLICLLHTFAKKSGATFQLRSKGEQPRGQPRVTLTFLSALSRLTPLLLLPCSLSGADAEPGLCSEGGQDLCFPMPCLDLPTNPGVTVFCFRMDPWLASPLRSVLSHRASCSVGGLHLAPCRPSASQEGAGSLGLPISWTPRVSCPRCLGSLCPSTGVRGMWSGVKGYV